VTKDDHPRLLQTLLGVYAYYDRDLTEMAMTVWVEDLEQHDIVEVERAFVAHRRDPERGQWLPKSADILRRLSGGKSEAVHVAWAGLLDAVRAIGAYGEPELEPATLQAIDSLGGWRAICRADERDLPHLQRRFSEAYGVWRDRIDRGADLPLLAGAAGLVRLQ
jgi:hypothetical protein